MTAESQLPIGAPSKVVGLGAPISVRIFLEPSEIPVLLAAIDEEVAGYARRAQLGAASPERNDDGWIHHIGELARMRTDVDVATAMELVVVWPTVLALGVVHRAFELAERRAETDRSPTARAALAAAGRTRRDLDAVDRGGLEAVWL